MTSGIAKAEERALAAQLATELAKTPWRDVLDLALDAMKVRRYEEAERYFAVLDVLRPATPRRGKGQLPSWHFEVPYRGRNNTVRWRIQRRRRLMIHTYTPERRAKQILAAMFHLAHDVANRERGMRPYDRQHLARAFGVTVPTMRSWIQCGLRDLGVSDSEYSGWSVVPWRDWDQHGFLEEDFEPEDVRRERRRQRLQSAPHARFPILFDPVDGRAITAGSPATEAPATEAP